LAHFGLNVEDADDLFQQAVYAILHGTKGNGEGGRTPRPLDLQNEVVFSNYLRGVISSIAEGWARTYRRETRVTYSLEILQEILADPTNTRNIVEYEDLKRRLFEVMRELAGDQSKLLPTINAWEKDPHGRIPCVTSRKHVLAVRRLAQEAAQPLGLAPPPGSRERKTQATS